MPSIAMTNAIVSLLFIQERGKESPRNELTNVCQGFITDLSYAEFEIYMIGTAAKSILLSVMLRPTACRHLFLSFFVLRFSQ